MLFKFQSIVLKVKTVYHENKMYHYAVLSAERSTYLLFVTKEIHFLRKFQTGMIKKARKKLKNL